MSPLLPAIDSRLLDLPDRELLAAVHGPAICRSCPPDALADLAHRERRNIAVRMAIVSVGVRRYPFPQLLTVGDGVNVSTRAVLTLIRAMLDERAHPMPHPPSGSLPSAPERMPAAVARRQDEVLARRIVDELVKSAGRPQHTRTWRRRADRFSRKRPVELRGA